MFGHIIRQTEWKKFAPSLRLLLSAGAPMDWGTVSEFKERFGQKIHAFYGSSETGGIAYDNTEDVGETLTMGTPMPETQVSLDTPGEPCAEGEGRIRVKGNAVARGYAPGGCGVGSSDLANGEFLTGDLGKIDDTGRLFLTGRVSLFVNVAGRKVNPAEVERVLLEMPEISQAKSLGLPCDKRGQKLVACMVPRYDSLSVIKVRTYLAARLSPHKIPRELLFVKAIPLDSRGKTDRPALEKLAQSSINDLHIRAADG